MLSFINLQSNFITQFVIKGAKMHRGELMNGFTSEEDSRGPSDQTCSLVEDGHRCHRKAGNASYSKRIQKIVTQRKLKLHLDQGARHIYICDYHKSVIQSARSKRGSNKYSDDDSDSEQLEIDLSQLSVNTLRRYKKHFNVNTKHGLNKAQLADKLTQHFKTILITDKTEKSITNRFMYLMRLNGNKLDRKNGSDTT